MARAFRCALPGPPARRAAEGGRALSILASLAVSLLLTVALELGFALLWRVGCRDLPLVALANVLTNPAVVLCRLAAEVWVPALPAPATLALETGAILAEARVYRARSGIPRPRAFSLCANLFSYGAGLLLVRAVS